MSVVKESPRYLGRSENARINESKESPLGSMQLSPPTLPLALALLRLCPSDHLALLCEVVSRQVENWHSFGCHPPLIPLTLDFQRGWANQIMAVRVLNAVATSLVGPAIRTILTAPLVRVVSHSVLFDALHCQAYVLLIYLPLRSST